MKKDIPLLPLMPDVLCDCGHKFGIHDRIANFRCIRCGLTKCKGFTVDGFKTVEWSIKLKKEGLWEQYKDFFLL
jgi:hypothetical protein